jgi:hypothetical protein
MIYKHAYVCVFSFCAVYTRHVSDVAGGACTPHPSTSSVQTLNRTTSPFPHPNTIHRHPGDRIHNPGRPSRSADSSSIGRMRPISCRGYQAVADKISFDVPSVWHSKGCFSGRAAKTIATVPAVAPDAAHADVMAALASTRDRCVLATALEE